MQHLSLLRQRIRLTRERNRALISSDIPVPSSVAAFQPTTVSVLINDICNFRCKMCFKWKEKDDPDKPTVAQWERAFRDLAALVPTGSQMSFSGGELLLSPEIFDLIAIAKQLGFQTHIPSNGSLIDAAMTKRLVDAGLDLMTLSLDSLVPETHDDTRGYKGSYDLVMRAIRHVRDGSNIGITICAIIMEPNLCDLVPLAEWVLAGSDIATINFQALTKPANLKLPHNWYEDRRFAPLWPKDLDAVDGVLGNLKHLAETSGRFINSPRQFDYFRQYFRQKDRFIRSTPCTIDEGALNINHKGDVFFCLFHGKLANIKDRPLHTLDLHHGFATQRQHIRSCSQNCHSLVNCNFKDMRW